MQLLFRPTISSFHKITDGMKKLATSVSEHLAYIAFGSNIGDRAKHIKNALQALSRHGDITSTSFLYESTPMYLTEQPNFLNGAIQFKTNLTPFKLLRSLKLIEKDLGRNFGSVRNGPRPIDLDIITYDDITLNDSSHNLTIPHPRLSERDFVLQPLCDIDSSTKVPGTHGTTFATARQLLESLEKRQICGVGSNSLTRVTPLPSGSVLQWGKRTLLMGVLNVTPDSFSDGGKFTTIDAALKQVDHFLKHGFDVIDVGGQSTRPGANDIGCEKELSRVESVVRSISDRFSDAIISVDTYRADVARAAIDAGAKLVNDVSAGNMDKEMNETIAETEVATVLMHMRGTPQTMRTLVDYGEKGVVQQAANELSTSIQNALAAGVRRWSIVADAGIGFAKTPEQSIELLKKGREFRLQIGNFPVLLGASRKSWMKGAVGNNVVARDWGTAGAVASGITFGGVDMVRVHDARVADAVRVCDLICKQNAV